MTVRTGTARRALARLLGMTALAGTLGLSLAAGPVLAQPVPADPALSVATLPNPPEGYYWPGATHDPAIPTPRAVLGFEIGSRITTHAEIVRYFEALAAAAPDRTRLVDYGRTWMGRRLVYMVVGTREQIAALDAIRADADRLADPRTLSAAEAETIIARQPAIVWLAHTVHGDESGPADSALLLAYHLLAATNDPRVDAARAGALVIINPLQNPDGRERFIASGAGARGMAADADPLSAERDQQWPGGRANHFAFDLNRDWFALTQPETQSHTQALLQWHPQVMVDAHEMGTDETFFFPPEADPINPNTPAEQRALRDVIGRNNAAWFDRMGIPYFTRETFDLFYPGYGDGWPSAHGTVSMTYEQGSSRGLVARRSNGTLLTYPETVRSQFVAALSTVEAAARDRTRFVRAFWDFRRTAVEEGRRGPVRSYIIPAQADRSSAERLAAILTRQEIEVTRTTAAFTACGRTFEPGAHVISAAQPAGRLVRNLLEPRVEMDAAFIARQEARRARGQDDEIYDVTAWSLPLMYNLEVVSCAIDPAVRGERVGPDLVRPGTVENSAARVAFVAPSGDAATNRLVVAALRAGLRPRAVEEAITIAGRTYPEGSIVFAGSENPDDLSARLQALARTTGARVTGLDTSWVTQGPSLGSSLATQLRLPRIAIAWDRPVARNSAGNFRYVLERKLGFEVTPIRVDRLASANLGAFDVVVLPDNEGSYARAFGASGAANLSGFVQRGGVLIGMAGATSWMADPDVGLIASRRETAAPTSETEAGPEAPGDDDDTAEGTRIATPEEYAAAIADDSADPKEVDGAIVRADIDPDHWLTVGLSPHLYAMLQGSDIYRPLTRDQGDNPVRFSGPGEVAASGIVWDQNRQQLAYKPMVMLQSSGRGFVVGFTVDPGYRAHTDGLDGLILNTILQTTARARPVR